MTSTHYEVLGVAPDSSPTEVRSAWVAAVKRSHSDRGGSDDRTASLNAAYHELKDPARRRAYDAQLERSCPPSGPQGTGAAGSDLPEPAAPWGVDDAWTPDETDRTPPPADRDGAARRGQPGSRPGSSRGRLLLIAAAAWLVLVASAVGVPLAAGAGLGSSLLPLLLIALALPARWLGHLPGRRLVVAAAVCFAGTYVAGAVISVADSPSSLAWAQLVWACGVVLGAVVVRLAAVSWERSRGTSAV